MSLSVPVVLLALLVVLIFGFLIGWLGRRRRIEEQEAAIAKLSADSERLQMEAGAANVAASANEASARLYRERSDALEMERREMVAELQALQTRAATAESTLDAERRQSAEKLALLNQAREELSNQFKVLAGEILEEKSRRFTEQNRENIGQMLTPLREKITEFQSKVEEVQKEGIAGRSELREQIGHLKDLNERLSQDASNLVNALKGSSKVQGDWGEFILERLLEDCGLHRGREYTVQESMRRDDGRGARLDVVVNLPGGRHLVIDSKVSLTDYTEYCNGEEEPLREAALNRHLASVRTHLKGLSERDYPSLLGLETLDFVVMFVPIEPAFMLALARDPSLWNDAWRKNILLVSPSTLLFVIRTVAHLWKQEHQTRNVHEIAKKGGDLYDKFVGFVEDLKALGTRLTQAKEAYDDAYGKLSIGRGNLVLRAENLRNLGVKARKTLPPELTTAALEYRDAPLFELTESLSSEIEEPVEGTS